MRARVAVKSIDTTASVFFRAASKPATLMSGPLGGPGMSLGRSTASSSYAPLSRGGGSAATGRSPRSGVGGEPPSSVSGAAPAPPLLCAGMFASGAGSALACGLAGVSSGSPEEDDGDLQEKATTTASATPTYPWRTGRGSGLKRDLEISDDVDPRLERRGAAEVLRIEEDRRCIGELSQEDVAVLWLVVEGRDDLPDP